MTPRGRYGRPLVGADDDDSMLERDVLLNLMAVFLVLIGAPAMVTAAQAASRGAAKGNEPVATIYLAADASLRLDDPGSPSQPLEIIAATIERSLENEPAGGPIVLCHAPQIPADQLFHVLQRINAIPNAKTFLALQQDPSPR